jgi:hypothetical protein
MNALTSQQILQAMRQTLAPEQLRTLNLCMWATEVLRRECPVYWL